MDSVCSCAGDLNFQIFVRGENIVTVSLGCSKAMPKTSKPKLKLAVVAEALTNTHFSSPSMPLKTS